MTGLRLMDVNAYRFANGHEVIFLPRGGTIYVWVQYCTPEFEAGLRENGWWPVYDSFSRDLRFFFRGRRRAWCLATFLACRNYVGRRWSRHCYELGLLGKWGSAPGIPLREFY